jgi:hypothetical protein
MGTVLDMVILHHCVRNRFKRANPLAGSNTPLWALVKDISSAALSARVSKKSPNRHSARSFLFRHCFGNGLAQYLDGLVCGSELRRPTTDIVT